MICKEVVMKRRSHSTPYATITMLTFFVNGLVKAFRDYAPLQCKVLVVVERCALIGRPAHRTVFYDDILSSNAADGIILLAFLTPEAEAHVADDNIVSIYNKREVSQADAVAGGRVSRNGDVAIINIKLRLQRDGTRD